MRQRLKALLFLCALLTFARPGEAATLRILGKLTPAHNSVLEVMAKAGCDDGWLAQVLKDSKINPAQVRSLPIGRKIYFRGSCKAEPTKKMRAASHMIAVRDSRGSTIQILKKKVTALEAKNTKIDKQLKEAAQSTRLGDKITKLSDQLAAPTPVTVVYPRKKLESILAIAGEIASILALGILVYGLIFWPRSKPPVPENPNRVSFDKTWHLDIDGKPWNFDLVAVEPEPVTGTLLGRYKCPECGERNLFGRERNFLIHVRTKHKDMTLN
jgi:hypothetical protein